MSDKPEEDPAKLSQHALRWAYADAVEAGLLGGREQQPDISRIASLLAHRGADEMMKHYAPFRAFPKGRSKVRDGGQKESAPMKPGEANHCGPSGQQDCAPCGPNQVDIDDDERAKRRKRKERTPSPGDETVVPRALGVDEVTATTFAGWRDSASKMLDAYAAHAKIKRK